MAHFLRGNFKGFYQAGPSACVKDMIRFKKLSEGKVYMEVTRRDMESLMGRFWRYENATINLLPVDEEEPRLGGKVQVKSFVLDLRTLTLGFQTQYGVYSDDFVTFGTFDKSEGNPLDNEEVLLKIVSDVSGEDSIVSDKTTFKFENNQLFFSKEVNEEKSEVEVNHPIVETKLDSQVAQSWTETFFYGVGNKAL